MQEKDMFSNDDFDLTQKKEKSNLEFRKNVISGFDDSSEEEIIEEENPQLSQFNFNHNRISGFGNYTEEEIIDRNEQDKINVAIHVKEELEKVNEIIKENIKNVKNDQSINQEMYKNYAVIHAQLNELIEMSNMYYEKGEFNDYPDFTLQDKDKFLNKYSDIAKRIEQLEKVQSEIKTLNKKEQLLSKNAESLKNLCANDIRALIKVKGTTTLPKVIAEGRQREINIEGQEIQEIGALQSSRKIIEENGVKKVFTPNTYFDEQKLIIKNLNKHGVNHPEFAKFFDKLSQPDSVKLYKHINIDRYDITENGDIETIGPKKFNGSVFNNLPDDVFTAQEKYEMDKLFATSPEFRVEMYDFLRDCKMIENQVDFHEAIGSKKDEPVNERNSAMSVVAELLGMNNLIAHSEKVTVVKDGERIEGTVMDFADGVDINNIDPKHPIATTLRDDVVITPEAKKQISDLQILDYICGNLDRHAGNLFYKYDLTDPNKPKLKGIIGIDNDSSFYTKDIDHCKGMGAFTGLTNLGVIDEETRTKIMSVSPAMLKMSLLGLNLSKTAMDKALERFTDLQYVLKLNKDRVVEKPEDYKLPNKTSLVDHVKIDTIKDKETWDKLNLKNINKDFNTRGKNQRRSLMGMIPEVLGGEYSIKDRSNEKLSRFKINKKLAKQLERSKKQINSSIISANSGTKLFRGSSKQYKNIQKELKLAKKMQEKLQFASSDKDYKDYIQKLESIKNQADAYLTRKYGEKDKKGNPIVHDDYTNNRISIMNNVVTDLEIQAERLTKIYNERTKNTELLKDKTTAVNIANGKMIQKERAKAINNNELKEKLKESLKENNVGLNDKKIDNNINKSKETNFVKDSKK